MNLASLAETLGHLAAAHHSLKEAQEITDNGLTDDHCANAFKEVLHAIDSVIYDLSQGEW